ncbi:MAG: Na/Pi cotransporter family protein, partial [Alphaproteobacteria bacterium]|nr:Na/Pi cotransporter family protein [Alphaproteobacteria bacterium]
RTLKVLLERWTDTHLSGLFTGATLTVLVQSSSAVTVAAIGFVNAGILTLERSVWVIFGSNIGTTMTGWLVALIGLKIKVQVFALPAIGVGMFINLTGLGTRRGALGQAIAGFGVIFVGIAMLKEAFEGVAGNLDISAFYAEGMTGVLTFVGVGFVMTLLTQASAAAISIALTAAAGNLIGLEPAAALVIGANIGTTSTALLASIGATPNAKRVAASHVAFNILTGGVAVLILPLMLSLVAAIQTGMNLTPDVATTLAMFHTVFNVLGVILIWPIAARMVHWLKNRFVSLEEDMGRPRFLDRTAMVVPSLALESLIMELSRLQQISVSIVRDALDPVLPEQHKLRQRLGVVESLSRGIGEYARIMYQAQMPPSVSSALMHPYRALQHFEEIARIGAELPHMRADRPALDAEAESLLGVYTTSVREMLKLMTSPDPAPDEWSPKRARAEIRDAYAAIKQALLTAGSRGDLPFDQLEATVQYIDHIHACGVRAIKAERRLRLIREAAAGAGDTPGVDRKKRTDDG